MRLDVFLKKMRIIRQRTLAKQLCDAGAVAVNGKRAKPSQVVQAGDSIRLESPKRILEARVLEVPGGNVARRDVARYVEVLRDERSDEIERLFGDEA